MSDSKKKLISEIETRIQALKNCPPSQLATRVDSVTKFVTGAIQKHWPKTPPNHQP